LTRIDYDPESDALYLRLAESGVLESEEVQPGIILDFDEKSQVAGVEVLNASKRGQPTHAEKIAIADK
jgi:uncharacterized protein YuzE